MRTKEDNVHAMLVLGQGHNVKDLEMGLIRHSGINSNTNSSSNHSDDTTVGVHARTHMLVFDCLPLSV